MDAGSTPEELFEVQWAPFQLNASAPLVGIDKMEYYDKKFGKQRVAAMIPQMIQTGLNDGIKFSYGGKTANTLNSHRLAEWAREEGGSKMQNAFIEAIFKRYFEQEMSPNDSDALCGAAKDAGLDVAKAKALLSSTDAAPSVRGVQDLIASYGQRYGVSGVPHFVIGKYSFSGAQDAETMQRVLSNSLTAL